MLSDEKLQVPQDLQSLHAETHSHYLCYPREQVRALIERIGRAEARVAELEAENLALSVRSDPVDQLRADVSVLSERNRRLESDLSALRGKYAFEENQELCIGFDGGCDGDLVATPHNDNCPAQARDRVLNPHLYDAARAAEGAQPLPQPPKRGDEEI
jgi:hypothetical protein